MRYKWGCHFETAPFVCLYLISADDIAGIAGDNQFFVGGNHKYLDLGIGRGDHDVLAALGVGFVINGNTQIAKVIGDSLPGGLAVFTYACGEHDRGMRKV